MVSRLNAFPLRLALLALFVPCAACTPAFDDRSSQVVGPRVLAVRSIPAEAPPKAAVAYRILVVDENGTVAKPQLDWQYCTQPKASNELNDVAAACFEASPDILLPLGSGTAPSGMMPINACAQFGPDVPQPQSHSGGTAGAGGGSNAPSSSSSSATGAQGRPTDPDSTGGYYQPVILRVSADQTVVSAFAETRITCNLAGSTSEQFAAYTLTTRSNENPKLLGVSVPSENDAELTPEAADSPLAVAGTSLVTLRANWPTCPADPICGDETCSPGEDIMSCPADCTPPVKGCGGPESYSYLDPADHVLRNRHESFRVSWFATAGSFASDHTGSTEADFTSTSSDNTWRAPKEAGPVFMWVVLRDDRGGVDWQSFRLDVQ
ncbi:MAG: hypothetical protein ABJB12_10235 [Pseudomonadota bacterium]